MEYCVTIICITIIIVAILWRDVNVYRINKEFAEPEHKPDEVEKHEA